jgi:hypothetical protein
MKKLIILFVFQISSFSIFAQSISLDPNSLQVPRLANNPTCSVNDKGKLIFNTTQNLLLYCDGTTWIDPSTGGSASPWVTIGAGGLSPKTYILNNLIGIGTNSPSNTLDVQNSTATMRLKGTVGSSTLDLDGTSNYLRFLKNGINQWAIRADGGAGDPGLDFVEAAGGIRMTLQNSTGNVGIGTTTPVYKLQVNGSVGGVGAYQNVSDGRLKKNIKSIENPLEKVLKLHGITFDWDLEKANGRELDKDNHYGFIAQEIEKVLPQVVSTANDADKTKSVAYGDVVPVLVEAIKEQQKQIKEQHKEIKELQNQLSILCFKK